MINEYSICVIFCNLTQNNKVFFPDFSNILKNNNIIPTYFNFMYYYFLRRFMSYLWLIFSEYYYIFNFLFGINFRTIIVQKKPWMIFNHSKLSIDQAKKTLSSENSNRLLRLYISLALPKKTALEKKPTQTLILIWYWIIQYSHNLVLVSCCLITLAVHMYYELHSPIEPNMCREMKN